MILRSVKLGVVIWVLAFLTTLTWLHEYPVKEDSLNTINTSCTYGYPKEARREPLLYPMGLYRWTVTCSNGKEAVFIGDS